MMDEIRVLPAQKANINTHDVVIYYRCERDANVPIVFACLTRKKFTKLTKCSRNCTKIGSYRFVRHRHAKQSRSRQSRSRQDRSAADLERKGSFRSLSDHLTAFSLHRGQTLSAIIFPGSIGSVRKSEFFPSDAQNTVT